MQSKIFINLCLFIIEDFYRTALELKLENVKYNNITFINVKK